MPEVGAYMYVHIYTYTITIDSITHTRPESQILKGRARPAQAHRSEWPAICSERKE